MKESTQFEHFSSLFENENDDDLIREDNDPDSDKNNKLFLNTRPISNIPTNEVSVKNAKVKTEQLVQNMEIKRL